MKKIFSLVITLLSISAFSQTLKTFNGTFDDDRLQHGIAVYTYYEDPETHEYLKQGSFKYTLNGKGDQQGYNQTITGNFEKGLKTGRWTYSTTMTDFGSNNPYYTGTVSLVSNYKNGYADGNWKEVRSYKTRKKYYSNGQYNWDAFAPLKTMTINMNFKNGYMVGEVNINDEFANFKASGNYDNNSLCTGTWIINDLNWGKNRELIYKDNCLYEFIARSNSGAVEGGTTKYQTSYDNYIKATTMTAAEREEIGFSIDTICGGNCAATNNIQEYFPKLFSVDYFLYNFIGGDLSFEEGFKGGCDIRVNSKDFTPLTNIAEFTKAEEYYSKNELIKAYELYSKINLNKVKPSERKNVSDKIARLSTEVESLLETYNKNSKFYTEYIKSQNDSVVADFNSIKQNFKIKSIKEYNQYTYKYEDKNPKTFSPGYSSSTCDCKNPWNELNYSTITGCFALNKGFYEPYQIAITEYYSKLNEALDQEESSVQKSVTYFDFKNVNNSFYTYDKDKFLSNISIAKKNYERAKLMMNLVIKFEAKSKQIETLNSENKKKTLFNKYSLVLQEYQTKYDIYPGLEESIKILNESIAFFDKVIALYSLETKELEKQLKDAETVEQVEAILLGK